MSHDKFNLIKIEMYIINHDGNMDNAEKDDWEDLIDMGLNSVALTNNVFISKFDKKELEWYDDIDINYTNATRETYEKYFE